MKKESDHKKSINIALDSIITSMNDGKEEIFAITEQINKENRQVKADIAEVRREIRLYNAQIEKLKKMELESRKTLLIVSSDFNKYNSDDIKDAYDKSYNLQQDLMKKQLEIDSIIKKLELFENRIQKNNELVSKADELLSRIEIMSDYMKLDSSIGSESEDLFTKWILFQENEKNRIARDIHDGPAQTIASLVIRSDIIKKLIEKDSPNTTIYKEIEQLKFQLRSVIKEIRKIMYDLRPTSLDELGFSSSIQGLISKTEEDCNIKFSVSIDEDSEIKNSNLKIICFRIIQESLNNIIKHSKAEKAYIYVKITTDYIDMIVQDNGVGFDTTKINSANSFGLSSLKERVALVNGNVNIDSKFSKGTAINVKIPNKEDVYA
ncbi:two-component system, NarL family, sensor histidine kinase DegS [[Eubacterium] yurii]|jgi:sensor histidine kinase|nr:two-component system, NarL family, sensor histidine kinase DegS [[Eubacterium] yurii]